MHDNDRRSMPSGSGKNDCSHLVNSYDEYNLGCISDVARVQIRAGDAREREVLSNVEAFQTLCKHLSSIMKLGNPHAEHLCKHRGIIAVCSKGDI